MIFSSCSTEVEKPENEINSAIKITMTENLEEPGNVLNIKSETVEFQNCSNFGLITNYNMEENNIQIEYTGIFKPEICLTAFAPATSQFSLDLAQGIYNVNFINEGTVNRAELLVDKNKYVLELLSPGNIVLARDILYKIPDNTFWGRIGYHEMSSEILVDDFFDYLMEQHVDFIEYPDGDYGYFHIEENEILPPENHGHHFVKPIIFNYSGDFDTLKNMVLQFAETHRENISIYLMNYKGKEIRGWIE